MWRPIAVPSPEQSPELSDALRRPTEALAGAARAEGAGAITELLLAWGEGDRAALDALVPIVYAELRSQAQRALRRERVGHTLQSTALVNEVFLRLVDQRRARWEVAWCRS